MVAPHRSEQVYPLETELETVKANCFHGWKNVYVDHPQIIPS